MSGWVIIGASVARPLYTGNFIWCYGHPGYRDILARRRGCSGAMKIEGVPQCCYIHGTYIQKSTQLCSLWLSEAQQLVQLAPQQCTESAFPYIVIRNFDSGYLYCACVRAYMRK